MSDWLPWLAVAGVGALHGLNPATGWMFAVARGVLARDGGQALRALVPIAVGHAASVALVAAAVVSGLVTDRAMLWWLAAALFAGIVVHQLCRLLRRHRRTPGGPAALALWSLMISTAHGSGLMLVPALIPLCLSDTPAREITATGSMVMALAAVSVHTAAMLAVTGVIAVVACRGIDPRWRNATAPAPANEGNPHANFKSHRSGLRICVAGLLRRSLVSRTPKQAYGARTMRCLFASRNAGMSREGISRK